jgi:hypothetical protein
MGEIAELEPDFFAMQLTDTNTEAGRCNSSVLGQ